MKKSPMKWGVVLILIFSAIMLLFAGRPAANHKVLLIGIDGGSWDIIRRLASQNKIPNLQKLMQNGASGYLDSLSWRKKSDRSMGLFSPIIWSTIATGKLPSKHGIEDFKLPVPGSVNFRIGHREGDEPAPARLIIPFNAREKFILSIRAKLPPARDASDLELLLNDRPVGKAILAHDFQTFRFELPTEFLKWEQNRLAIIWKKIPSSRFAADIESIRVYAGSGHEVFDFDHSRNPEYFSGGWIYNVQKQFALASSFHFRTRTLWEILSGMKKRIGVVGWWATWPAYEVNGYLVSSNAGLQGERLLPRSKENFLDVLPDLTYPAGLLADIKTLYRPKEQMIPDFEKRFFKLGICGCIGLNQEKIVLRRFWQDQFFADISRNLLDREPNLDVFAVYFRGTDTMAHQFIGWTEDFTLLQSECGQFQSCDLDRLHNSLDEYYSFIDARVGEILKSADRKTYTIVVTDHGEFASGRKGIHKNNGFIIATGPGIKKINIQKASVLDITPTILHLLNLPVGQDMDGKVLLELLDRRLLLERPVAYIESYDRIVRGGSQQVLVDQQLEEQDTEELKALGYIN